MFLEIYGWALAIAAVAGSSIQLAKLRHSVEGVSIATFTAWMWSWLGWAYFSLEEGYWSKAVTELSGAVVEAAVVVTLIFVAVRLQKNWFKGFAIGPLMLVGTVVTYLVFGTAGALIYLTLSEAAAIGPQVWAAAKPQRAGISTVAWVVSALMAGGWVLYGFLQGDLLSVGWAIVFAPAAAFIAYRAYTYKPEVTEQVDTPVEEVVGSSS